MVTSLRASLQPPVAAGVSVSLEKDFQELTEIGSHPVTLFVENNAGLALRVTGITVLSVPEFIDVHFTLPPGQVVGPVTFWPSRGTSLSGNPTARDRTRSA